jgi:hypothetical protein
MYLPICLSVYLSRLVCRCYSRIPFWKYSNGILLVCDWALFMSVLSVQGTVGWYFKAGYYLPSPSKYSVTQLSWSPAHLGPSFTGIWPVQLAQACFQLTQEPTSKYGGQTGLLIYALHKCICVCVSLDSAVTIATGYGLHGLKVGVQIPVEANIFTSSCRADPLWGPPSLIQVGTGCSFPGGKGPGERSWPLTSPTSAEA